MRRTQHRPEKMHPAQIAGPSPRQNRTVIAFYGRVGLASIVLAGIAAWCQPAAAAVCRVPAAVLCEGCVERLSIRVAPGGTCRISFTPATPPEQVGAAKFVDINIEAEPPRTPLHRPSASPLSVARHAAPLRASAACFVFNGRRFCE